MPVPKWQRKKPVARRPTSDVRRRQTEEAVASCKLQHCQVAPTEAPTAWQQLAAAWQRERRRLGCTAGAVRACCALWRVWRVRGVAGQRATGDVQHENQLKTSLAASPSPLPSLLLLPPPSGVVGKRQRRKLISITSNKASRRRRHQSRGGGCR